MFHISVTDCCDACMTDDSSVLARVEIQKSHFSFCSVVKRCIIRLGVRVSPYNEGIQFEENRVSRAKSCNRISDTASWFPLPHQEIDGHTSFISGTLSLHCNVSHMENVSPPDPLGTTKKYSHCWFVVWQCSIAVRKGLDTMTRRELIGVMRGGHKDEDCGMLGQI